jgi:hypothetical protein
MKRKYFEELFKRYKKKNHMGQPNPRYTNFTSIEDYKRSIFHYQSFVSILPCQDKHFVLSSTAIACQNN